MKLIVYDILILLSCIVGVSALVDNGLSPETLHHLSLFCGFFVTVLGFAFADLFFSVLQKLIDRKNKRKPPKI